LNLASHVHRELPDNLNNPKRIGQVDHLEDEAERKHKHFTEVAALPAGSNGLEYNVHVIAQKAYNSD
jgi:hypothetical protein